MKKIRFLLPTLYSFVLFSVSCVKQEAENKTKDKQNDSLIISNVLKETDTIKTGNSAEAKKPAQQEKKKEQSQTIDIKKQSSSQKSDLNPFNDLNSIEKNITISILSYKNKDANSSWAVLKNNISELIPLLGLNQDIKSKYSIGYANDNNPNVDNNAGTIKNICIKFSHNNQSTVMYFNLNGFYLQNKSLPKNNKNNHKLSKINYPSQKSESFEERKLDNNKIQEMILSTKNTTPNFYSHIDYQITKVNKPLNSVSKTDNKIKLELLDKNQKPVSGVKWFLRTYYPQDAVYSAGQGLEDALVKLDEDGTVTAKEHTGENKSAEIWAEYKGYLFRRDIMILNKTHSDYDVQEEEAREKAIEVAKDWHNLSNYQKALKAYDWITKNIAYQERGPRVDQTAYSAIIEKRTVCTGYTLAFKMFMDILGVPCSTIQGNVRDPNFADDKHIWNLVELDDGWYHVDATWGIDRNKLGNNNYYYFLIGNDDISLNRDFIKPSEKIMGKKYLFSKIDNYISDLKQVQKVIEIAKLERPDDKGIVLQTDLKFNDSRKLTDLVSKSIDEQGYLKGGPYINEYMNMRKYSYLSWDKISAKNKTNINLMLSAEPNGKFIKIDNLDNIELSIENIDVKGAFIKDVVKKDSSYFVSLINFDNTGDCIVAIRVFKDGYKFKLNQDKFKFVVQKHSKPEAYLETYNSDSGILKGVDNSMQYRIFGTEWKDVNSNEILLKGIGTKQILVRRKATADKEASDIQFIYPKKQKDINFIVKVYNNEIIGVDQTMQYRLKDSDDWININTLRLKNLSDGIYEIRVKPQINVLASDYQEVKISRN
ncbi:MAG6410 family transglutaminase-related lipoprotein [Mycoplasma tauri]|uniref:MAG6410 family transglutaminase-related lipoprotein n=1 Tax=Mycoplasma tauri TaxID=547987 RepID=UPI001CC01D6D|nr:transglutaminase domain-containing protein [Mycoplasma tauri]MBZ4203437.1 hypothetical protein [Mycoplasma tauri]